MSFVRTPLAIAIALAVGIAIAPHAPLPRSAAWVLALVLLVSARRPARRYLLPFAFACAGLARGTPIAPDLPATIDDRGIDRVEGIVDGLVVKTARGYGARLTDAAMSPASIMPTDSPPAVSIDDVWVWTTEPLLPGERIAAIGRVHTPRGSLGPGQPDRADALHARGAELEMTATHVERLSDDPGPLDRISRWAMSTQDEWSRRIDRAGRGEPDIGTDAAPRGATREPDLDSPDVDSPARGTTRASDLDSPRDLDSPARDATGEPDGDTDDAAARAALRGIVAGDRAAIPESLDARWRAVGTFHVLSVSGLHLAVVAGLVFAFVRRAIAASPLGGRGRPARWAAPPALVIAVGYTLVTGAQLATVRALFVVVLVLVAAMLDRPIRLVDAIGVAAIAVLAWRPADLFDPSFQLSFTAALVLAVMPTTETSGTRGFRGWVMRGLVTSAWVSLATAPITAYHFQQITPGGIVGNLVFTPLLELVALPLALFGVVVGWNAPIELATLIVRVIDGAAGIAEHAMPIGRIAIAEGVTLAVLVVLSIVLASRPRRRAIAWTALCVAWSLGGMPAPSGVRVTFVDVGQGDAAVIELPDGAVWLIDAGGHANARDLATASAPGKTIARTLAVYGKQRVDLAIVSHPHPDHYLGLASLGVPIDELWSARELEPTAERAFATLVDRLGTRHTHPPLGVARSQAGVELVVWAPRYEAAIEAADPVRTVNDNSLVVELRYRGRSILFAGDLEAEGEDALVAAGIPEVDVVKVAHHGSPTSSTAALVEATRPSVAVISCGRANQFGFPSPAVVERWRGVGADVARTDRDGSVTVHVDPAGRLTVQRFATPVR